MTELARFSETYKLKHAECELVQNHFLPQLSPMATFKNFDDLIEQKNNLYQKIRGMVFQRIKFPVTNLSTTPIDWFGMRLSYVYGRQGLFVLSPLKAIYDLSFKSAETDTVGFFTISGFAAIRSVVDSLFYAYGDLDISGDHRLFFETFEYMNLKKLAEKKENPKVQINILDSSAADFAFPSSINKNIIYFLDSTCLKRSDLELEKFIKKIRDEKGKLILVRSHLKLDSNGMEYGPLGSIVLVNPKLFPTINYDQLSFNKNYIQDFQGLLRKTLSLYSHFAPVENIYPFFELPDFSNFLTEKDARLKINYRKICQYLKDHNLDIREYHHCLFFTFKTSYEYSSLSLFMRKAAIYLAQIREKTGFPIYFADSFGFDFFSVTAFCDYEDPDSRVICRVSLGDLVAAEMSGALAQLAFVLKKLI